MKELRSLLPFFSVILWANFTWAKINTLSSPLYHFSFLCSSFLSLLLFDTPLNRVRQSRLNRYFNADKIHQQSPTLDNTHSLNNKQRNMMIVLKVCRSPQSSVHSLLFPCLSYLLLFTIWSKDTYLASHI